jgi:hypothetical protein
MRNIPGSAMTFEFSPSMIEEYERLGFVVFREILPPRLIADLRRVADRGRELAREAGGPLAQRLEPVANWDIDQKPFEDYRDLPELRVAIQQLLSPRHTYGNRELHLGVLIEPVEVPYCMPWHQDLRHLASSSLPFLTPAAKRDPDLFNQINCALYQDDSLWVVPGSHSRDDTEAEREAFPDGKPTAPSFEVETNEERERICLEYCRRMPGATRVHLDPGDVCVYRGTLWHTGFYVPYVKRATIIDLVDTPAYAEFRTKAGLDKELADRTTTRSMRVERSLPQGVAPREERRPVADVEPPQGAPADSAQPPSGEEGREPLPESIHSRIAATIARETAGVWTLKTSSREGDRLRLQIQFGQGDLDIEFGPTHGANVEAFLILDGVAFKYFKSSDTMSRSDLHRLDAVARKLRKVIRLTAPAS